MESLKKARKTKAYNELVGKYNTELESYKANLANYNARIDPLNTKVSQANALAKEIGTTSYLVPVPAGTKKQR